VSIEISGLNEAIAHLQRLKTNTTNPAAIGKVGNIGVAAIKSNLEGNPLGLPEDRESTKAAKGSSQVLVNSGKMKGATFFRVKATSAALVIIELFNRTKQAVFAVNGTKAHVIRPKSKKALKFKGNFRQSIKSRKIRGDSIFAKFVNHPGTPVRNFMQVRQEHKQQMLDALKENWK